MPSSSSRRKYRLLVVTIKSAKIATESRGPFYVKLWIDPAVCLKTEPVHCTSTGSITLHATWDQGFVFAISDHAIVDGKAFISFEIFRRKKYLRDVSVGKVNEKISFESQVLEKVDDDVEAKYHTDNEDSDEKKEEDCEEKKKERPEMGKKVKLPMMKANLEVEMLVQKGELNRVGVCKWEGFAMEHEEFLGNIAGKSKKIKKNNFFLMCAKQ